MFEIGMVVAVLIAVGQFAKVYVPTKYVPLLTMALGIVAGMFYIPHASIQEAIMYGLAAGLSANGMYDVTKMIHNPSTK